MPDKSEAPYGYVILTLQQDKTWLDDWDGAVHTDRKRALVELEQASSSLGAEFVRMAAVHFVNETPDRSEGSGVAAGAAIAMRTPLTREQLEDLQTCLWEWVRIRQANGRADPPTIVDIVKSCLLGRMTMTGKGPLPVAPPTAFAAPWYSLIEDGKADLSAAHEVYGPYDTDDQDGEPAAFVNICHCRWKVLGTVDPHSRLGRGGHIVHHDGAPGLWLLSHRVPGDPAVEAGQKRQDDDTWAPFYLGTDDWLLMRIPDGTIVMATPVGQGD